MFSEFVKESFEQEAMRLTDGPGKQDDPYYQVSEKRKEQQLWRRVGDTIYTKKDMLIQKLEDDQEENKYKIVLENDKLVIATQVIEQLLATKSATLFLDKTSGLLITNSARTSLFCSQSLSGGSTLYQCRE